MAIRLPPLKLDYLKALTDDTGLFQHAKYCVPKRSEGYTTDDNARALVACVKYYSIKKDPDILKLSHVYLAFLNHMQKLDGDFHNYLSYERRFLDVDGSADCMGRALWGCGCTVNSPLPNDLRLVAKDIFNKGLPWVWKSTSLRFYAAAILGLSEYYRAFKETSVKTNIGKLADNLVQRFYDEVRTGWRWFEPHLTYDNARLTQALFVAYSTVGNQKHLDVAVDSMGFLLKTQMVDGVFVPIGNDGWFKRGGKRAVYDQQPLEATAMVEAAVDAYYATKDKSYIDLANNVFQWFLGRNSQNVIVYNAQTGGCCDGVNSNSINRNQGAESSVSYLLARLKLQELKQGVWKPK